MTIRVLKFGGTSVGDAARIADACNIVASVKGARPVVVVSAASRVTDMLLRAVAEAARGNASADAVIDRVYGLLDALGIDRAVVTAEVELLQKTLYSVGQEGRAMPEDTDLVASFGERISVRTFAATLTARGVPAVAVDAFDAGMITDEQFGGAEPLPESDELLCTSLCGVDAGGPVPVVTGFIGRTRDGKVTTLGRGGSDYTAAIVGAALSADEIQIWTDVDGVMSCDPRLVPGAKTIPTLSFTEAAELAYFGAKVLHPKTILPAVRKGIPVRVLNTFKPTHPGTVITAEGAAADLARPARAIALKKGISAVQVVSTRMLLAHGFLAKVFDVFARHKIVVDLIATSEVSVSLTVDRDAQLTAALEELRAYAEVSLRGDLALVAVVGRGIGDAMGSTAGRVFGILAGAGVGLELISAGSGRANISMVVAGADAERAVKCLHVGLFGDGDPAGSRA